jgi:phosphoribosylaminoimidazolecarboxamide formyltransferase / IMP cyclohydrolase
MRVAAEVARDDLVFRRAARVKVGRALISVSDKTGVVGLARALVDAGIEVVSSGGTARVLDEAGVEVIRVAEVTGAPEILDGRVKTLHPAIHAAILADRRNPRHVAEIAQRAIAPIDLVVCNLYPFARTAGDPDATEDDVIEQIDVGGPALLRAAAKNFHSVAVVVHPARYPEILDEITRTGIVSEVARRMLAIEAFEHTASYDAAIAAHFGAAEFPAHLVLGGSKLADLRYGENPHQRAALYGWDRGGIAAARQLHGKELSYNNLLDADAAYKLVRELQGPAAAIVKHSNPCGAAVADDIAGAYAAALECDRTSAFGGIVALNGRCDRATATQVTEIFTEVVLAPAFDDDALDVLRAKKNLRVLLLDDHPSDRLELRSISGGLLAQSPDPRAATDGARVVTKVEPSAQQWDDLWFAWTVVKHTKSNAIVLASGGAAVGIGAGQMSRVEAAELAARRAADRAKGTVCASDAFFPFRDGLDAAVAAGAVAVIQPGGSMRDDEIIAAADAHGIPMVFTGRRHFRH